MGHAHCSGELDDAAALVDRLVDGITQRTGGSLRGWVNEVLWTPG
jgi:hypothetical protein